MGFINNKGGSSNSSSDSKQTLTFVATADNTTNISFPSISNLNSSTVDYDLYFKGLRFTSDQYVINANLHSVDLVGWSLKNGQSVILKCTTKS